MYSSVVVLYDSENNMWRSINLCFCVLSVKRRYLVMRVKALTNQKFWKYSLASHCSIVCLVEIQRASRVCWNTCKVRRRGSQMRSSEVSPYLLIFVSWWSPLCDTLSFPLNSWTVVICVFLLILLFLAALRGCERDKVEWCQPLSCWGQAK